MTKKIICLGLILVMIISLSACSKDASSFSEEEHIERISDLVEQRYIDKDTASKGWFNVYEDEEFTGFTVYPLFTETDELGFFLVEFEPFGYVYIKINKTSSLQQLFWGVSMYTRDDGEGKSWRRYRISEDGEEPPLYEGQQWKVEEDEYGYIQFPNRRWEVDEDGEYIYYYDSHYKVANIGDEKRYLLKIMQGSERVDYVPAVKREDKYLNLVSMQEMMKSYQ